MTHLAVKVNENGKDEFFPGGSKESGITFSGYGLDIANNEHAQDAYNKLVQAKKEDEGLSPEDEQYLNSHYKDKNPSSEVAGRFQQILGSTLKSTRGQQIIADAVEGAKNDNELWVDWVNALSLRDRNRPLNPIDQANLGIWSNRTNGLKETSQGWDAGGIKADKKNITTTDLLNWIKGQTNFNTEKDTDPAVIRNKNNQWKQHLENIVTTVKQGVGMQIIRPEENPQESIDALNEALKTAGSGMRLTFTPE